ncbi:bifunctional DNA primase/polymerase [Blastococcus sp. TF02A-30]|uniref:bifunctional DNA primase/polymerase n=1 Tax=Blastococcus sp. TF02A-30 TaxID=2250580 RepID=UPI000DEBF51D|nr:bifunctional DNA primase/polymerase [Blastococcus sp. TF02A-30]RBY92950.1 hypothetical protein DQ241_02675 [Blastococcus sp. TF02A-30]
MSAPTITGTPLLEAAVALHGAGLCVLPAAQDGTKRPAIEWREYQERRPDESQLRRWFGGDREGLGVVCGAVSGGLELTELEGRAVEAGALRALVAAVADAGEQALWDKLVSGHVVRSPSGGLHFFYRLVDAEVPGNQKLAATADHVTLAETRGEGGWVITAPSGGRVHPREGSWTVLTGSPAGIPTITGEERERFHALIRATLDERPVPQPVSASAFQQPGSSSPGGGASPGDDYAARTSWVDVLEPAGWTRVFAKGEVTYWRRPGKRHGISASTGYGGDWLYVFTSSTEFEPERTYTRFGAYAVLEHDGDHRAAAKVLVDRGFGRRPEPDVAQHPVPVAAPCSLDQAHEAFRRWLGDAYDLQGLDVVLAAAAVEQLDGDPVWLLMVSGPGNAKTETVGALAGAGAHVTSTISSEGALLSATSKKERTTDATGGLLRKLGDRGLLVIKDFTTILSMSRDPRAAVLAALREVYDGRWERNVGTDGGRTLTWTGRLAVIGGVTTAYDSAHAVIAAMGDRFALVRVDSGTGRLTSGRKALANVGSEVQMRAELAEAAGGVLAQVRPGAARLTDADERELLGLADLVTLSRTAVERDGRGEVVDAHMPEAPTRFAKMLGQLVRGGLALGIDRADAMGLARRVARDSVPPLRLTLLADLLDVPNSTTAQVRKRVQKPRSTVDRALQELHVLGLLRQHDLPGGSSWVYELSEVVDPSVLRALVVTRNVTTPGSRDQEERSALAPPTDISGDGSLFAPLSGPRAVAAEPAAAPAPAGHCEVCGLGLDPVLGQGALHPQCAEVVAAPPAARGGASACG